MVCRVLWKGGGAAADSKKKKDIGL